MTFWTILLILTASASFASGLDIDGRINLELDSQERFKSAVFDKEAQAEIKTKRLGGARGVVDVDVSSDSRGVALREIYLEHLSAGGNRILIGQGKKKFGLDWAFDMEERLTLSHGVVSKKLSAFPFVGRDTMIAYRIGDARKEALSHEVSLHSSEALNAAALYSFLLRVGENTVFASYSLLQADGIDQHWRGGGAQAFAAYGAPGAWRWQGEVIVGRDPIESELSFQRGDLRDVLFSSASAGTAWRVFSDLEPFVRGTLMFHDLSSVPLRTAEWILGTRYFFGKRFYAGGELSLLDSNSAAGLDGGSHFLLTLRYFF